ncbi:MAG: VOC family protein [Dietzia sp.]
MTTPLFRGGTNIAMKIPAARYDDTVAFYRDTLGFDVVEEATPATGTVSRTARTGFGPCTLWFDCVDNYAQPDIWLELLTDDLGSAVDHLGRAGVSPRDELEPFPEGSTAHWICNPVGVPHVLHPGLSE